MLASLKACALLQCFWTVVLEDGLALTVSSLSAAASSQEKEGVWKQALNLLCLQAASFYCLPLNTMFNLGLSPLSHFLP